MNEELIKVLKEINENLSCIVSSLNDMSDSINCLEEKFTNCIGEFKGNSFFNVSAYTYQS